MSLEKVIKSIPVKFANYEKVNDTVAKVKVFIMYAGVNRNGSYMSKDAVEKAIPSLYGVPIVGEYLESAENFGGHGGKIIIDSNGIEFIETTKPYGFLDMSEDLANVRWEEVEDEEGNKKNYLVADAYLWRKRYPELDVVFENGANQSMEIDVMNAEWKDKEKYYDITEFEFSALCILGKDEENEEFNTEPCFEQAGIKAYSLDKDDFKSQFSLMVKEIKESFNQESEIEEVIQTENEEFENSVEETQTEEFTTDTVEEPTNEDVSTDESEVVEAVEDTQEQETVEEFDYKTEYETLQLKYAELEEKFNLLNSEIETYRQKEAEMLSAQIELQKDEVFEKYDELFVENEEYEKIKESREEYSVESLESTLALLYVKSNVQFSLKDKSKPKLVTLENESKDSKPVVDPYGGLFNKK